MTNTSTRGIKLQPRDIMLLHGLFDSRVFTLPHVASLYFDDSLHAARKRVQKLKRMKLVAERPRNVGAPSILFLTARGLDALAERDVLRNYPPLPRVALRRRAQVSELTLRHELDVATARVALARAYEGIHGCEVLQLTTWPRLHQFAVQRYGSNRVGLVKPDGFARIRMRGNGGDVEQHFFLEVDRSTESQGTIVERVRCYRDHYRAGGFAESLGYSRGDYRRCPFRVLFVFRNDERRNNAAAALLAMRPPVRTLVWMTTLKTLTLDPLAAIWTTPSDYAEAVAGTPFERAPSHATYRRETARDKFVASSIRMRTIFNKPSMTTNPAPLERTQTPTSHEQS